MGPLNDLRHQQETSHPALTSPNAVKVTRELLSARPNTVPKIHIEDICEDTHVDVDCQPHQELIVTSEFSSNTSDLNITSMSENVSVPVKYCRTYSNLNSSTIVTDERSGDNECQNEREIVNQSTVQRCIGAGEGSEVHDKAHDVKKELDEQGLVAIVELLASNKEKQVM